MRKRTSLRRWKARCRAGRWIPEEAIQNYSLGQWFEFREVHDYLFAYRATERK